jgi:hypothetical protein|tara:strand:- start:1134 stop:2477 length:1344 start_codon:yes stop_codon:yes gene_type:complete
MASTYLSKTFSGAATSNKIGTQSLWVKKCSPSSSGWFAIQTGGASGGGCGMIFETDSTMTVWFAYTGSWQGQLETNRLFRDPNAWYHIVLSYDTTQSTASDRLKLYVNGVQETSFSTATYPAQDTVFTFLEASRTQYIGGEGASGNFDGCISHFHCIDGTAYTPSAFGETDSTTGEWKIKTSPSVTYGNNGFFILKDGNSVTDQSGRGNNWTVGGGTLTKTEDNPSNVFATLNNLDGLYINHLLFSDGNTTVNVNGASNKSYARSTLGMTSGKFYFEAKNIVNANWQTIGITDRASGGVDGELGGNGNDYVYRNGDGQKGNNNSFSSYGNTYSTNDIIGCAVDLDNLKIYFSKNGVWQDSGDPTSGSTGTGAAFTITSPSNTQTGFYFFAVGDTTSANNAKWSVNFGNGYFGTTAVSSAGTNASGIGIFEYDCPNGYTSISTKGLNL